METFSNLPMTEMLLPCKWGTVSVKLLEKMIVGIDDASVGLQIKAVKEAKMDNAFINVHCFSESRHEIKDYRLQESNFIEIANLSMAPVLVIICYSGNLLGVLDFTPDKAEPVDSINLNKKENAQ